MEIAEALRTEAERCDSSGTSSTAIAFRQLGPEILKDPKYDAHFTPFEMLWTLGFNVSMPVINLTTDDRHEIFYTATNVGILYDYCKKQMRHMRGHREKIVSVSVDRSGQWLVTADNGKDNVIMLWDTVDCDIVWTIFDYPGEDYEVLKVSLSPNARLLVTISNKNETTIDFWMWTYGNEKPHDSYTEGRDLGKPKSIEFHPNQLSHLMVVFERNVLFFCWDYAKNKVTKSAAHKMSKIAKKAGSCADATFVEACHECFVSTTKGEVLVFGNTIFSRPFNMDEKIDNDKIFVKYITIAKTAINCLTSVDELVITGDASGNIMFLDKRLKLLSWVSKRVTNPICSISFKVVPRRYTFEETLKGADDRVSRDFDSLPDCEDRSDAYEFLMRGKVPTDATLQHKPFVIRDFLVSTLDGAIYMVDLNTEFKQILSIVDSTVTAIDIHDEKPYILIGYAGGRMTVFNYETHEEVLSKFLPSTDADDATITTIKYSPQSLHLACGRSNGELWMLHSCLLTQIYVDPFRFSTNKVMKVAFSTNSLQMAYYDDNMTVFGFYYDTETEDWVFKGKVRSHYKEIANILFLDDEPAGLYTLGTDRNIIKYTDLVPDEEELDISVRDRIEQKDIPIYFIPYTRGEFSKSGYFLMVDDKHKYKLINAKTNMCTGVYLGPAYGCYLDNPVCKMEFIPYTDKTYLIFMTKKHIGIQLAPIDGNPYKFIGCLGHPEELLDFKISNCGRYLFSVGKNERIVTMWLIKPMSVDKVCQLGGVELQPYFCLLDGGRGGFHYQEMRDLFYYMQILQQGEQLNLPRVVSNMVNIGELPDLMRACGYYPSEYEIENLMTDIRYKDYDQTGLLKEKATFCEFVKLFINHKPVYGYSMEKLEECFDTITSYTNEELEKDMAREDFVDTLITSGEQMSVEQLYRCIQTLLHEEEREIKEEEKDFSFVEERIDFYYLAEDILGLDLSSYEGRTHEEEPDDYYSSYY